MKIIKMCTILGLSYLYVPRLFAADKSCYDSSGNLRDYCKLNDEQQIGFLDLAFGNTARNIVAIIGLIAGVLSVIYLIIGGINYITAEGDPAKIKGAKSTILYAIVGLSVSILAPAIVGFVLQYAPK